MRAVQVPGRHAAGDTAAEVGDSLVSPAIGVGVSLGDSIGVASADGADCADPPPPPEPVTSGCS